MYDQAYDQDDRAAPRELNASIDRALFLSKVAIAPIFAALHRSQFDAPWLATALLLSVIGATSAMVAIAIVPFGLA